MFQNGSEDGASLTISLTKDNILCSNLLIPAPDHENAPKVNNSISIYMELSYKKRCKK